MLWLRQTKRGQSGSIISDEHDQALSCVWIIVTVNCGGSYFMFDNLTESLPDYADCAHVEASGENSGGDLAAGPGLYDLCAMVRGP